MSDQTPQSSLLDKMKAAQKEFEAELEKRSAQWRYTINNRKVIFEQEVLKQHRQIKAKLAGYVFKANPLVVLVAPIIYIMIIPLFILDIFLMLYQLVCFPVYKISKVQRKDYFIFDRVHLAYLNPIEKLNCVYCSYGNGLFAYAAEVAGRTEQYWCPIKHALRVNNPHAHYKNFFDYGDAKSYHDKLDIVRMDIDQEL